MFRKSAEVAHLVERDLAKVEVAGSSPVFRSQKLLHTVGVFFILSSSIYWEASYKVAPVVKLVDTQDLKSCDQ